MIQVLVKLQNRFGGDIKGNKLITRCPSCSKDNHFYVYYNSPRNLYSVCYRCGYWLPDLYKYLKYEVGDIGADNVFVKPAIKLLPVSGLPDVYTINDKEFAPAYDYLVKRGVSRETIIRHDLGLGKSGIWKDRIVFYVKNEVGFPVFVGGRTINPNVSLRYYYPPGSSSGSVLFNLEYIPNNEQTVVLMEGPFDVLCSNVPNAVALFGKRLTKHQRQLILSRFNKVIVWLDNPNKDPDSLDAAHKICHSLMYDIKVELLVQKCGSDPGDCPDPVYELNNSVTSYNLSSWLLYKSSML